MSVGRSACCVAFSRILKGSSCKRRRKKVAHPHEVVTGERQQSRELDLVAAAYLGSAQQADVLAPSEDFLPASGRSLVKGTIGFNQRRSPLELQPASGDGGCRHPQR